MSNYVELVSGNFTYNGPVDLTQYVVVRTEMQGVTKDRKKQVQVNVILGRRLLSIILTVIFPTVILNLIGHTANYFKEFFFEAVISLNVTVMLGKGSLTFQSCKISLNLKKKHFGGNEFVIGP